MPDLPFDTRRPFARAEAIAAGVDPRALRGPLYRRYFRGVLIDSSVAVTPQLRIDAALVPFPASSFASHASAARIHSVPVSGLPDEHVTLVDRRDRRTRAGIVCHVSEATDVVVVAGTRTSSCLRTFVELGELLPLVDLVVAGDDLTGRGLVDPDELGDFCARSRLKGAAAARRAAVYVRPRVDSPMETRLQMLLVLAGVPEPEVNATFRDEAGAPLQRHDLLYLRSRTAIEYDGRHHIERERQWRRDIDRREAGESAGIRQLTLTSRDVFRTPEQTLLKVARVLRDRAEPGVPARLHDGWRPHFPGLA